MKIEPYLKQDCILILPYSMEKECLKKANQEGFLIRSTFVSLESLPSKLFYCYHDLTLYELHKSFEMPYSLIQTILPYLYHIEDKKYNNEKLDQMVAMKQHLQNKGYLIQNPLFKTFIKNKQIIFYSCEFANDTERKALEKLKKEFSVIEVKQDTKEFPPINITGMQTMEEEVVMVAEKVTELLENGMSIDEICMHVSSPAYDPYLHRIFGAFGIPYRRIQKNPLLSYDMTRYFLDLLKTEEKVEGIVAMLRETYNLEGEVQGEIYQTIVSLLNKYSEITNREDLFSMIKYEVSKITVPAPMYENVLAEVDITKEEIQTKTVFLLGFMTNLFPKNHKDDRYLSDVEASYLQISSSISKNKKEKEKISQKMSHISHLEISYSKSSHKDIYTVSSFIEDLKEQTKVNLLSYKYQYSNQNYNRYLLCKNLDIYTKYGQETEELKYLYLNTSSSYKLYKPSYTPILSSDLHQYLKDFLTLSYSSLETFYQCSFRYYIQYILKIKEDIKESASIRFGNLVHKILCRTFGEEKPYETIVEEELKQFIAEKEHTIRDLFYLQKYKKEVLRLIEILYKQKESTEFKETYLEECFTFTYQEKIEVKLTGYIDKVLTFKDEENTYVIVIDYKTGTIHPNFNPIIYGLNMQLLVYLYLLKKNDKNTVFAGAYWQNVMKEILPSTEGKTYDALLEDAYRLDGYTTTDSKILSKIDQNIENSFIKGMKLKKDGTFYAYAKVLAEEEIEQLLDIVDENIVSAIKQIENAEFTINPKKIGFTSADTSCNYCPYRDICYRENSDIVTLKEYKNLEFIGDENGKN
ncbi:MAG: PD-(D/E)XK nuclease family protein [Bacilli bacterium]|nr:PD-(D/E)XK nuclease family protein [Bacilli bacterium]